MIGSSFSIDNLLSRSSLNNDSQGSQCDANLDDTPGTRAQNVPLKEKASYLNATLSSSQQVSGSNQCRNSPCGGRISHTDQHLITGTFSNYSPSPTTQIPTSHTAVYGVFNQSTGPRSFGGFHNPEHNIQTTLLSQESKGQATSSIVSYTTANTDYHVNQQENIAVYNKENEMDMNEESVDSLVSTKTSQVGKLWSYITLDN